MVGQSGDKERAGSTPFVTVPMPELVPAYKKHMASKNHLLVDASSAVRIGVRSHVWPARCGLLLPAGRSSADQIWAWKPTLTFPMSCNAANTANGIPGDELIWWYRQRCGKGEEVHGVLKEDLAGGRLPVQVVEAGRARQPFADGRLGQ